MASASSTSVVTLEAVREQLKLMGHQVPDEVISAFLEEAGFTSGQEQPNRASKTGQDYKASFDMFQTQAGNSPPRHSTLRPSNFLTDTARSSRHSSGHSKQAQRASGVGNRKGQLGSSSEDDCTASHSDNSCSSCISEYEARTPFNTVQLIAEVPCVVPPTGHTYFEGRQQPFCCGITSSG